VIVDLPDENASHNIAAAIASCLFSPLIMSFSGEIGSGKTTIIRAVMRALGVTSAIKSPTFSLVESYHINNFDIHHFDLYRVHDETELEYIGFRDYFANNAICFIEWPERVSTCSEIVDCAFSLDIKEDGRQMQGLALSSAGSSIISCLSGK
jgi:tRNA threonylcarbamoyladenosine biosynthesis protein TsaE